MSSNYQHNLNKHITTLTSQLLTTYINIPQSHPHHNSYVNYIKKYLNDKSMLFIPRQKDVEKELDALCEKLIINSQLEKSQLLYNYVNRLKTIYESKPVIVKENLFSFIHLVLSLAHNPLKTVVNIDIMKENFETRYIMNKIGMFIKNRNYVPDEIKEIQCDGGSNVFDFEEVDYNEKTPTWSEDDNEDDDNEDTYEVNAVNEVQNDIRNDDEDNTKQQQYRDDNVMYVQLHDKDKLQLMFTHFYKLFLNKPYYSNMSFAFFTHLLNLNSRIHPITHSSQITLHVDNDFLLLQLLHNLTTTPSTITSSPSLTLPFTNLSPIDLPSLLLSSLLATFNTTYHNLSFLHHISSIFASHNIHTAITSKLCSIIFDFLTYHNTSLDSFAKLLHYQKGKIENSHCTFIKHIIAFPTTKYTFINTMLSQTEMCINTLYTAKAKLSLFIFICFYIQHIQHIVNYFVLICKSVIQMKENTNNNNNAVLVKRILDGMYRMAWGANEEMHIEVFMMLCEEYAKFVYEFIVNGNLLDVWNECFFEHAKVKQAKKKIVFCFDERFKIFNWVDSFKIKSYVNEHGVDAACVPIAFMLGNIHFKILETAKTMFLMKNLNVANYFDDMNKEVLLYKEEEEERNDKMNRINDDHNSKVKNGNDDNEDVLEDLRMLNERIRIRKEEINEKGKELNMLEFALNNEVKKLNINNIGCKENMVFNSNSNSNIIEFQQSNKCINSNDIDMYNNNYNDDDNEQSTTYISSCNNNNNNNSDHNNNSVNFIQRISCFNTTNLNTSNEIELKEISSLINTHHHHHHSLSSSSSTLHNYNINLILHKLILNRITTINTLINQKFLSILTTSLHIEHHFNLIFHIFLFKAGFSMNKFILHLNNFILSPNKSPTLHENNFYLKTLLNTLSTSPQSDLSPFKAQIVPYISLTLNSSIPSYTYHSNEDLLTLSYAPPSPINIFFDDQVIKHYNIIFNLLIKMKRSFILIRDINLDKKIKEMFVLGNECTYMKVIKVLIEYRMFMLDFAYEFEFFVFHFVIDVLVKRFNSMVSTFDSIDKFINMHYRLTRDLIMYLGINDDKYMKKVYKVMNMIVVFPSLLNRLMYMNRDNNEEMEYFLIEVDNSMEKFIRKKRKLIDLINIIKDKLNNI